MPGNKLSVRDAPRLKGRCFLINIKAVFTTSWPNCKTKHEVPHSGHSPEFHSPNMKNITHTTSLTRSGTCSLDLVGGKRRGPRTNNINWSSYLLLEQGRTWLYLQPLQGGYYGCHMWDWASLQRGWICKQWQLDGSTVREIHSYTRQDHQQTRGQCWLWMKSDGLSFP